MSKPKSDRTLNMLIVPLLGFLGVGAMEWNLSPANAQTIGTECYQFATHDSPITNDQSFTEKEVWCYRSVPSQHGTKLVYRIDENGRTRPEVAMLVESNGTIAHASLLAGELTAHRLNGFNPLGAPLTPPQGAKRVPEPISPSSADSVDEVLKFFRNIGTMEVYTATMNQGDFNVSVAPEHLPWKAYWFPHSSGKMHNGSESPMAKYDRFVERRATVNVGAQSWEKRQHRWTGVAWAGHCNGWAAASIMRKQPVKSIVDPFTGIKFTPNDLKGLWIERDYCPKYAFFGRRNYGNGTEDPSDIYAHEFHNVLTYYVGKLGKSLLIDDMASPTVENRVVSGYKMKIKQTGSNTFTVDVDLALHTYDKNVNDEAGPAIRVPKRYRYVIRTDSEGKVKSGYWLSANPDFAWVPLAPGECKWRNPNVEEFWIEEILRFEK